MFGYLPLGAAFGILAIELGMPWWAALLMSLFIYAGAGQFLAVALLAAGAGLVEVAVATLMLNSATSSMAYPDQALPGRGLAQAISDLLAHRRDLFPANHPAGSGTA